MTTTNRVGPQVTTINAIGREQRSPSSVQSSEQTSDAAVLIPPSEFYVTCSRRCFALFWCCMLALHVFCAAYFAIVAYLYRYIMTRSVGSNLVRYASKWKVTDFEWISDIYIVIAIPHGFCTLQMILNSLWYRRLVFERPYSFTHSSATLSRKLKNPPHSFKRLLRQLRIWRMQIFGRRGILGIESENFHLWFLCQEGVEVILQSIQAYRMSCWLPRVWLNRSYVGLLIANCWCTSLIQKCFAQKNAPLERLLVFLVNLLMDLVSIMGIPIALIRPYLGQYDPSRGSFGGNVWYNDTWLINMMNEMQIIMTTSYLDMASKFVITVALLSTMIIIKSLLREEGQSTASILTLQPLVPTLSPVDSPNLAGPSPSKLNGLIAVKNKGVALRRITRERVVEWVHRGFVLWGVFVLGVQLHADYRVIIEQCNLQVRPWLQSKPSCSLLEVDCYRHNLTGAKQEMQALISTINEPYLEHIVFLHCPHLEMPPNIQHLTQLFGFKIYNSTLVRWDADAALTNTNQPHITFMFIIRVNLTGIPNGLLTDDYPRRLTDVEFSVTNLTTLPEDLHTKWPKGMVFVLEYAQFKEVPSTIPKMQVSYLSLSNNQISEVPVELFVQPRGRTLWLNGNPIQALPADVETLNPKLKRVRLANTELTLAGIPSWMPTKFLDHAAITAGGTEVCELIEKVETGEADATDVLGELKDVYKSVSCIVNTGDDYTYYPLVYESRYDLDV